jgi:hypothetical protein
MRKGIVLAFVVAILIATWLTYSKVMRTRREASYKVAMTPFQRDLHMGMDRTEVNRYLASRNRSCHSVRYGGSDGDTCQIEIAEEPDGLFCDPWTVYIALEFNSADKLRDIHIRKIGTCL